MLDLLGPLNFDFEYSRAKESVAQRSDRACIFLFYLVFNPGTGASTPSPPDQHLPQPLPRPIRIRLCRQLFLGTLRSMVMYQASLTTSRSG